jgi:magnesium chelatase family protein
MQARELREHCRIDGRSERLLRDVVRKLGLSARAYDRVLRLARTIADLDGADRIGFLHVGEAVQCRAFDRPRGRR